MEVPTPGSVYTSTEYKVSAETFHDQNRVDRLVSHNGLEEGMNDSESNNISHAHTK